MDQIRDIITLLPTLKVRTVFDIGANVGLTAKEMALGFPKATIHAFEPVGGTYEMLEDAVREQPRIKCAQMAFGDMRSVVRMEAKAGWVKSKISDVGSVEVEVHRGDEFCASQGIERINFLKIDTEGYDLKVCQGFESMLKAGSIDLLQVECGLNSTNKLHVPFQAFRDYLDPLGYMLFKLYDQAGWPVRRGDAVFIAPQVVRANRPRNLARKARRRSARENPAPPAT